jgi:HEAT repeat protein
MGETEYVIQRCAAIARDHEPNVAGGAIRMLADMGDAGMDVLFGILGHSRRELRDAAARALAARADHPRVKEFVRSAAAGADERQRAAALLIVGRSAAPRKEAAPQLLVEALRPNILDCADQNRRKLLAMGTNATPAVLPLLKDPNSDVRAVAAGILGELGDQSALPALVAALGDEATTVRALAAETLGLLGDRQAAPALAKAVADRDPAVGESALASLSLLDTPAGWDAVLSAAASDDWRLRRAAAEGLGRCRDKRATDALARAVSQDTHWAVRRAAADSLGRTGIDAHVPFLIEALRDRHWFVSYAAHQSLRTIAKRDMEPDPELWRSWWEQNQKAAPAQ